LRRWGHWLPRVGDAELQKPARPHSHTPRSFGYQSPSSTNPCAALRYAIALSVGSAGRALKMGVSALLKPCSVLQMTVTISLLYYVIFLSPKF